MLQFHFNAECRLGDNVSLSLSKTECNKVNWSFGAFRLRRTGLYAASLRYGLVECTGLNRSHPLRKYDSYYVYSMRLILFVATFIIWSCHNESTQSRLKKEAKNDTAIALEMQYTEYFRQWDQYKDSARLLQDNPFGDSVIIMSDVKYDHHLPKLPNVHFKVLTRDEICEKLGRQFYPNILIQRYVFKTDTSIVAALRQAAVTANFDTLGNPLETTDGPYTGTDKCTFFPLSDYGLEIVKRGDSFIILNSGSARY